MKNTTFHRQIIGIRVMHLATVDVHMNEHCKIVKCRSTTYVNRSVDSYEKVSYKYVCRGREQVTQCNGSAQYLFTLFSHSFMIASAKHHFVECGTCNYKRHEKRIKKSWRNICVESPRMIGEAMHGNGVI